MPSRIVNVMDAVPPSRRSGPVPSEETTTAIRQAVVAELAERGYEQLSVEAVARRAGVGKAAVYRRHRTRQDLVLDVVAFYATEAVAATVWRDTGELVGDVAAFVAGTARYLADPVVAGITADILALAARDAGFAAALHERAGAFRRARAVEVIKRAVARGELPRRCDTELAADLLGAPLYWRLVVRRGSAGSAYQRRLVAAIVAAITASA